MIFGKTKLEMKVGIFVFVGIIILSIFIFMIGNFRTWSSGYNLKFIFHFVNGVKLGAPVRFAGVDVGEIKKINFINLPAGQDDQVELIGWVRNMAQIPADSTVWVNTLGLLGEKYIEIMPGSAKAEFVGPDGTLAGEDPIAMHEVAVLAKKLVEDIDKTFVKLQNKEGTVGKLLYDDALYSEFQALLTDTKQEVLALIKGTEGLVADIRAHPWKLFFKPKEKKPAKIN